MGRERSRRPQTFRISRSRGGAGRTQLVDRAQEARRVPPSLQRVRSAESRAIQRETDSQAHIRSGHHPQSAENRIGRAKRARISRDSGGVWKLRRLLLAFRRRKAEAESMENDAADSGNLT